MFQAASWPNAGMVYVTGTSAAHADLWLKPLDRPARLYRHDVRGDLNAFADSSGHVYLQGFDGIYRNPENGATLPLPPTTPVDVEYPLALLDDGTLYYSSTVSRIDLHAVTL